ncbi:GspH/FimT family pseudopilin [Neptunomonas phycophila]|uniref:GspH/FimT family pseudopilin n=1 Tax=Neptunomonas phycophila TaxID=1572645 RepID=UPI0009490348|nr:GspH/FimT family pseudopilin [Neptunomonas phycophila]
MARLSDKDLCQDALNLIDTSKQKGFSLIELLVTLVISVIIITLAIPAFTRWISQNELSSSALLFRHVMSDARSEAVKLGRPVRLCSRDGALLACAGTSLTGTRDWSHGAILFLDVDDNRAFEANTDLLLRAFELPKALSATWNRGHSLSFLPSGRMNWGSNGTFKLKSSNELISPVHLVVGIQGRIRSFEP